MRPSASPIAVWAGLIVLYLVWGSTYLGIKVAVETIPPFVMGFIRFVPAGILLAGVVALRNRRTHPAAEPPGPRRHPDRRRAAADGRHGPGRLGRADDPQRHRRAPHRPHADVARDLRPRVPGRAAAAGGRDRDRRRRRGGRDPRLADRGRRRPRPGRPARAARLPGLLGARRDLRRPAGGPAGARAVRERPRDDRRRPRPAGRERGHRRAGDVRPGRGLDRELGRHPVPAARRQPRRLHDVRLAGAGRAAPARGHLRVREPGGRGDPRRDRPPGAAVAADVGRLAS